MAKKENMPRVGDWVYPCILPSALLPVKVKVKLVHSMTKVEILQSSLPKDVKNHIHGYACHSTRKYYNSTVDRKSIALTKEEAMEKVNKAVKKRKANALKVVEECDALMEQVSLLEEIECDRPESI